MLVRLGQVFVLRSIPAALTYLALALVVTLICRGFVPWIMPSRRIRPDRPPARQWAMEVLASLRMILIGTVVISLLVYAVYALRGGVPTEGGLVPKAHGIWAEALWLALTLVAHDTWFYWTHRAMHHPRLFRLFHRRHHRSHLPTPFTAYSFDVGEAVVQSLFLPLWFIFTPTSGQVVLIEVMFQMTHNMIDHSGVEVFPADRRSRPLIDWFKTVTHHDLHHECGGNYGLFFTWWDRWMGTENPDYLARFAAATGRSREIMGAGAV